LCYRSGYREESSTGGEAAGNSVRNRRSPPHDRPTSYWIGTHYELRKKLVGRPNGNCATVAQFGSGTAKAVAAEHKVSERTVNNDSQFTRVMDTIADSIGDEARTEILDGDLKLTRQEVQQLAEIAEDQPQAKTRRMRLCPAT
jgi:hypothetical protein